MIAIDDNFDEYDRKRQATAQRQRSVIRSGQDIAPVPECFDRGRREACRLSLRVFCETYFPEAFYLGWSADHLRVIAKIEDAVLLGTLAAFAMPRGSGKTTIAKAAALWAVLFGHRIWPVLIAATGPLAVQLLKGIKAILYTNELLYQDFPEVCHAIRKLQNSPIRARGQHCDGTETMMEWGRDIIVFPRITGSRCAESRITCFGIESALRGQQATLSTGANVRPDLVLVDDPQTKASANSMSETENRRDIIMGDVLGLAGPTTRIAGLMACTVIRKDDLADYVLDPKRAPEWRGERTKMVYAWPKDEKRWEEYFRRREMDLHTGGTGAVATEYYRENQAAMDEGTHLAWPERFPPEFASGIEFAMVLRHRSPDVFAAEYQNEPIEQTDADVIFPTAQDIVGKTNGFERGIVPAGCTHITAFEDVQQNCLYWMVCAWEPGFTGYILDYGTWPKQHQSYFTYRNLRHTLGASYPGMGAEAAIFKGLTDLNTDLCNREWKRDDGASMKIGKLFVDSGDFTDTIASYCRQQSHGVIMPSKGRGIRAGNAPIGTFTPRPGERIGLNWIVKPRTPKIPLPVVEIDTNSWKTFTQLRLATAMGDRGCLSLFKASPYDHRALADHITAEKPVKTQGHERTVWEWILPPDRPDNHWFDCLVGCTVAASLLGISLEEHRKSARVAPNLRPTAQQLAKRGRP